jgi:hypothetical protein
MSKAREGFVEVECDTGHNSLFRPGPNWKLNACVGRNGGRAGFDRLALGSFVAGARLVKSLQEDPQEVDLVIYPLVVTYRHGIECALKHMARVLLSLCGVPSEDKPKKPNHKLMDDWNLIRPLLAEVEVSEEELERVEATLKEIVEIDPNGTSFRFPNALNGTVSLEHTTLINVEVFGERMARLAEFLENCWGWVDHRYEEKREYEAYMGDCARW